jgi:hypothetical protein
MRFFAAFAFGFLIPFALFAQSSSTTATSTGRTTIPEGLKFEKVNPTVNGWGVSFNLENQTSPPYHNGMVNNVTVDADSQAPTNGSLTNLIVKKGYCWAIVGVSPNCIAPVAVANNVNLQIQDGSGNDYWANLGVIDVQAPDAKTGGQATAGIVRGSWRGTALLLGLNSVAENYAGRALAGLMVNASETGARGEYFDNTYSIGAFIHKAKNVGFQVGGLFGANSSVIPLKPFVFYNAGQTAELWSITNGGSSASETIIGRSVIMSPANGFPALQMVNRNAGANLKNWQAVAEADGSWTLRAVNDAESTTANAIKIARSAETPASVTVSPPLIAQSYVKLPVSKVSALPPCDPGMEGAMAAVSDASSNAYYSAVSGGGRWHVKIYCNSMDWVVQ